MSHSQLAKGNQDISQELLSLGVIQHLLYVMGNREYADAQVQASLALQVLTVYLLLQLKKCRKTTAITWFYHIMFHGIISSFYIYSALCSLLSIS